MNTFAVRCHLKHHEQRDVVHFDLSFYPEAGLQHSARHRQSQSLLQHLLQYLLYDTYYRLSL